VWGGGGGGRVTTRLKMVRWQAIHKWLLDEGQRSPLLLITFLGSIYIYLVASNTRSFSTPNTDNEQIKELKHE